MDQQLAANEATAEGLDHVDMTDAEEAALLHTGLEPEEDIDEAGEERDIDAVFGRNEVDEQKGRWFRCATMGSPGDLIRDLGPKAEMRLARVPNDGYDDAMDHLKTKYERRAGSTVPNKVLRKRLPEIYARHIFVGMRSIRYQGQVLADTYANRLMLLRKYQPDLMNSVYRHAERLENFQETTDEDLDVETPEAQEAALGNS